MKSGTHRDLLFWCYARCFLCAQNHRRGRGPIETCNSGPKAAVLHAQIHRYDLGPIETCYSGAKHAVSCAQIDR